jgi:predicted membrane-bound spermidine synthase
MENILIGSQPLRRAYYTLFFFSGFSGLIYESIWTHYLKLFLGCAAYAQTLVLVIFMGGMAIGAWLVGRNTEKIGNLLLNYALVETCIGVLAFVFHSVFTGVTRVAYSTVIPGINSPLLLNLFKWGLATLFILPQTVLLGATFPLMSGGVIRLFPDTPGHSISVLYFSNSIGAVLGILVSGFFLIERVGLPGTILAAGLINVVVALAVWLLSHRDVGITKPPPRRQEPATHEFPSQMLALMMGCAALTGTASFMYEIGWIRMLCLVLGSSTHAFELMLSAFILGLAFGGYWLRRRIDTLPNPVKTLGLVQISMGMLALSTILSYGQTFNIMSYAIKAFTKTVQGYAFFNVLSQLISSLVMVPATFCAGMTLPLITYFLLKKGHGEGSIGKIYSANTLGSILGVLVGVQLVMPLLGVKNVIVIGAALDTALGLVLLWNAGPGVSRRRWGTILVLLSAVFAFAILFVKLDPKKMASGVFRHGLIGESDTKILFHKDGKTASVDLIQWPKLIILSTNGKPDASIGTGSEVASDEATQVLSGALPLSLHPSAKNVGVIGIGSGMTSHVFLTAPGIESVDVVEIEPFMVEGAKKLGEAVANTFNDLRCHIYIEDAKTFFSNHKKSYDIILSEPSNPWVSGVAGLFSKEFYRMIKPHIRPDGLFVQWLQLYELNFPLLVSIVKSLSENFNDYAVYFTTDYDLLIVAGKNLQSRQPSETVFGIPRLQPMMKRIGVLKRNDLAFRYLCGKKTLDPLCSSYVVPPNSDYFPILDLFAVQARYLGTSATELSDLRSTALPIIEALENRSAPSAPTDISFVPLPNSRLCSEAFQSAAIWRYFQGPGDADGGLAGALKDANLQAVRMVRSIHDQKNPAELERSWLPYFHDLMERTLPFLSPGEMNRIFRDVVSSPGFADAPDKVKDWVRLYQAIGNRQYPEILARASDLLSGSSIPASVRNDYCLAAAMLAGVVLGKDDVVVRLWDRYENKNAPPLPVRLLKSVVDRRTTHIALEPLP